MGSIDLLTVFVNHGEILGSIAQMRLHLDDFSIAQVLQNSDRKNHDRITKT